MSNFEALVGALSRLRTHHLLTANIFTGVSFIWTCFMTCSMPCGVPINCNMSSDWNQRVVKDSCKKRPPLTKLSDSNCQLQWMVQEETIVYWPVLFIQAWLKAIPQYQGSSLLMPLLLMFYWYEINSIYHLDKQLMVLLLDIFLILKSSAYRKSSLNFRFTFSIKSHFTQWQRCFHYGSGFLASYNAPSWKSQSWCFTEHLANLTGH